ncbi:glucan endo-1,3-beta-glucosidase 4-like [Phalaenopsis equestris]|uniref:glucan endo-1,3-beta-glucosidase 4-like n=1 Tax=Phalaenopsis equestris TaxID=78828 RepID=UPI0009E35D40|nr:glucan endo-1,3-beta-glucosidase 4-like [Phalaenopsis equestris]XP_020578311.1 glucan endo-1,3-beta-glucosidase 4-like [Phalaenopsis equestris]XP_020578312.1 glucan endo-1,3-beta-glucosidase 4-like [Phalaenopsis equestris]
MCESHPACRSRLVAILEDSTQPLAIIWKRSVILLIFLFSVVSGSFVGINIGTDILNLPSAPSIVSILQSHKIKHIRLFDADHQILAALANTGIEVMVGVPNDQLLRIGESQSAAADWINRNVAAYLPGTNITYIAVGNEVLTTIPNAALVLVPAMQFLQSALLAANLNFQVKVSSPQSMDMIPKSFPPSTATFNSTWSSIMYHFLQFLKNTGASFMLNAQPYYGFVKANGIFPIEYALFRSLNPDNQIVDPNTLSSYSNMFDAMVDAAYYSIQELNFSGIPIIVTASGWPSNGGDDEPYANVDNALAYNTNLVRHTLNNSGTPSQPNNPVNVYIHELFNEDLLPGPLSEKNWGLFLPNRTVVYALDFANAANGSAALSGMSGVFCVVNPSANPRDVKQGLDWVCGPGGANCSAIQTGKPCYEADNIVAIASYAYNDYYHRMQASGGTCNFDHTAMITTNDPSHGLCIFSGSKGMNSSRSRGAGSVLESPLNSMTKTQVLPLLHLFLLLLLLLFNS